MEGLKNSDYFLLFNTAKSTQSEMLYFKFYQEGHSLSLKSQVSPRKQRDNVNNSKIGPWDKEAQISHISDHVTHYQP